MKKYLFLLLSLPFLLAACDSDTTKEPEAKKPILTLTSDAVMTFNDEGKGEITYTLENVPEGTRPLAACDADWITNLKVAESITFTVVYPEPYLKKDEQTTIKVAYQSESFEVTVKCIANAPESTHYELSYIDGTYYEPGYWDAGISAHNYYVMLSSVEDLSVYKANEVYLTLDLYAATGNADAPVIPNGTYTFDEFYKTGSASCYYSELTVVDANGTKNTYIPAEGSFEVSDNKIEGYFIDEIGNVHSFVYHGTTALPVVEVEDIEFNETGYTCYLENDADYYGVGADNYIITILEDDATTSGNYLLLDIIVDPEATNCNGEFTAMVNSNDPYSKYIPGYIQNGYLMGSWYAVLDNGNVTDLYTPLYSGAITITDNGDETMTFTFDCVDDKNHKIVGSIKAYVYEVEPSAMALNLGKSKVAPVKGFAIR